MIDEKKTRINPRHRRRQVHRRKTRALPAFLMITLMLVIVLAGVFAFADIGGDVVFGLAKKYIHDNYGLELNAANITGNPVKGYAVHDFELADSDGEVFLSAGSLSGRVNFNALLSGKIRLAEISIGGLNTNIEQLIDTIQQLDFGTDTSAPAENADATEIPIDSFSLRDSRITSSFADIDIKSIIADLQALDININAAVNGVPLTGAIDMGEEAGLFGVNRSELSLGSGKIIATGGLTDDVLDLHAAAKGLNLKEIAALYPAAMSPDDYDGTANVNVDVTGRLDNPKVLGSVDYRGAKLAGFPVEYASANVNYSDYRVGVSNIQANVFGVPIQGEVAAAHRPGENVSVMIKLDGSEANLDGLDKILGLQELKALSGKVTAFKANISGYVDALSGLVHFTAPRIAYDGHAVTNIRAQMKLTRSDTAQLDGKFTFEGSQGYLNGKIASLLVKPNMDITAKIVELDVKRITHIIPDAADYKLGGNINASVNVKGSMNNPTISGNVNSPEFSGWGQTITKPAVNFTFKDKTLTLSKTEGTLNGMPVNLSGTISPLPSDNPRLNINATITTTPAALKAYVPDISQYNLVGSINAGVKIQGSVNSPSVNLVASSPNLQAMNMIRARDIEITTAMNGDLATLDKIALNASAKSITASGVTVSDLNAKVNKNGDKITLESASAVSGSGSVNGSGTASASGKEPLNFKFAFKNLALAPLAAASGIDMKGSMSGNLNISGKNSNPAIAFTASVPELTAQGFTFANMNADISGNMTGLKLNRFRADVDGAEVSASGTVQISPALKLNVNINGKNIDLATLLKDNPDLQQNIAGKADFTFNLTGNDKNITGKGTATAPSLKAYGLNLTDIKLPLSYNGSNNTFASSNATAKFYNGTLKNSLTFNIGKMTFTDDIAASGVDVNSLVQDASGGLGGQVTGTGKLNMKINGSVKDSVTYSGTGNFSMGAGAITGFTWVDLATRLYGTKGINYASVSAPLTLQTGKLILKSGSIVNANKNDKLYKYAKLIENGTIDFSGQDTTMNFMTEGSLNYQIVPLLQSGTKNILQSLVTGKTNTTADFRTVSLRISGKAASPKLSSLKIGDTTLKAQEQKAVQQVKETVVSKAKEKVQEKVQEKVKGNVQEKAVTKLQETKTKAQEQVTTKASETAAAAKKKAEAAAKSGADKVKQEITKGLQKGLGGLFKK